MKTKSIWGEAPSRLYRFKDLIQKRFGTDASICIVGACDGKFVMPFLRSGFAVTAYELDEVAIYGGKKECPLKRQAISIMEYKPNPARNPIYQKLPSEEKEILGLKKRVELEGVNELLTIEEANFYKNPPKRKFDAVFTSCSIPYPCNFDVPVAEIFRVLQESVSKRGYLYMDYMMPLEDCHTWRPEHYLRKGETRRYLEGEEWRILHIYEMKNPVFEAAHADRPEDHFHRFGYVLAEHVEKGE